MSEENTLRVVLVGPPGVGKTLIGNVIHDALGRLGIVVGSGADGHLRKLDRLPRGLKCKDRLATAERVRGAVEGTVVMIHEVTTTKREHRTGRIALEFVPEGDRE